MSNEKIFNKYYYLGNREIINNYKVGFLCSRKVPAEKILKIYDWAIEQREKGVCVVSGFHSKIEKDVFHYLSKGKQPIIVILARALYTKIPPLLKTELKKGRLLILSEFNSNIKRASEQTAKKRNISIIDIVDELFVPFSSPNGLVSESIHHALKQGIRFKSFNK